MRSKKTLIPAVVVLLCACGGSNSTDTISMASSFNPGLTGVISGLFPFDVNSSGTPEESMIWLAELSTGKFTQITQAGWIDQYKFRESSSLDIEPKGLGRPGYVLTLDSCKFELETFTFFGCVVFVDQNGQIESGFLTRGKIGGKAKLSSDGRFIALILEDEFSGDGVLELYTTAGDLVSRTFTGESSATGAQIEWHPDGRIFFLPSSGSRTVYISDKYETSFNNSLNLPESYEGSIRDLAISPNGNSLAFTHILPISVSSLVGVAYGEPLVVDLATNKIKKLVIDVQANRYEKGPSVLEPRWSPDGKWIVVKYGRRANDVTSQNTGSPGSAPYLIAIPSDGNEVPLFPTDDNFETAAVKIITNMHDSRPSLDPELRDRWFGENFFWISQ